MNPKAHLIVVEFKPGTDERIMQRLAEDASEYDGVYKVTPAYHASFGHTVYLVDEEIKGLHVEPEEAT